MLWVTTPPNIRWPLSAMTFPSYAPRASSKRSLDRGDTDSLAKAIRFALSSSNFSKKSTLRLTAGLLRPFSADRKLAEDKLSTLDRLYQHITDDHDELIRRITETN